MKHHSLTILCVLLMSRGFLYTSSLTVQSPALSARPQPDHKAGRGREEATGDEKASQNKRAQENTGTDRDRRDGERWVENTFTPGCRGDGWQGTERESEYERERVRESRERVMVTFVPSRDHQKRASWILLTYYLLQPERGWRAYSLSSLTVWPEIQKYGNVLLTNSKLMRWHIRFLFVLSLIQAEVQCMREKPHRMSGQQK